MPRRKKLSTTISSEGYSFIRKIIRAGRADNVAQALDIVLEEIRQLENRQRLERMTEEAYAKMSAEARGEEKELVDALSQSIHEIGLDE